MLVCGCTCLYAGLLVEFAVVSSAYLEVSFFMGIV